MRRGFSLFEALVAMMVLGLGLMALAAAAGISLRDMSRSRRDFGYWADVQQVADSLLGVGWNAVSSGSTTVRGRAMSWTVTTVTPTYQRVDIAVTRTRYTGSGATVQDSLVLYLAKPTS